MPESAQLKAWLKMECAGCPSQSWCKVFRAVCFSRQMKKHNPSWHPACPYFRFQALEII